MSLPSHSPAEVFLSVVVHYVNSQLQDLLIEFDILSSQRTFTLKFGSDVSLSLSFSPQLSSQVEQLWQLTAGAACLYSRSAADPSNPVTPSVTGHSSATQTEKQTISSIWSESFYNFM